MFPMRRKDIARTVIPFGVVGCLWIVYAASLEHRHLHQVTRVTDQEVLAQSEPICRLLVPPNVALTLSCQLNKGGLGRYLWCVDCRKDSEPDAIFLAWDADTGDLRELGNNLEEPRRLTQTLLTRHEAAQHAFRWLTSLGLASREPVWHVTSSQKRIGPTDPSNWDFTLTGKQERVSMKLDAYTGGLKSLNSEPWNVSRTSKVTAR